MIKKTILKYHGGKHYHADWVIKHFPKNYRDLHYAEPFAGGLSVLFKKDKSITESINDKLALLINFWKVIRDKEMSKELFEMAKYELHSEKQYRDSLNEIKKFNLKKKSEKVKMAFHYFYVSSFSGNLLKDWNFGKANNDNRKEGDIFHNKVFNINNCFLRLKNVQIFCRDALDVIKRLDDKTTFFYLDPPYPGTNQSFYEFKYNEKDFNTLIELLKGIKGKFLLSFYRQDFMNFPKDWILSYKKTIIHGGLTKTTPEKRRRIETLARNYKL